MRFVNFLSEDEDTREHKRELSDARFLELLRTKCKNSHIIATKVPFFKKDKGPEMMLVTPELKEERSSFWIDKLIQEYPAWKKFPSRSCCIKGYNSYERMNESDETYVIIPFDGARIGVAKGSSFYRSFEDLKTCLDLDKCDNSALTEWLLDIAKMISELLGEEVKIAEPKTYSQFKKALEKLDEIISAKKFDLKKKLSDSDSTLKQNKRIKDLLNRYVSDMLNYLGEKIDPESNGFSCGKIESFSRNTGDYEVWIDSPCLLIKRTKYIELHKLGAI